jgi:hypothetical protein
MKLVEVYNDLMVEKAWKNLDRVLSESELLTEADPTELNSLLKKADFLIFEAFGINPSDKKYFISGSARLFKSPELLKALNQMNDRDWPMYIGDLDVIVPDESDWKTLYNNYTTDSEFIKKLGKSIGEENVPKVVERFENQWKQFGGKIYRPGMGKNGLGLIKEDMEVFTSWDPNNVREPGVKKFKVRSTEEILGDAVRLGGHYYMSIYDVMDYKTNLNREKETELVKFINKYIDQNASPEDKEKALKNIYVIFKAEQQQKSK